MLGYPVDLHGTQNSVLVEHILKADSCIPIDSTWLDRLRYLELLNRFRLLDVSVKSLNERSCLAEPTRNQLCAFYQRDVCKSLYLLNDMCPSQLFLERWPFILRRSLHVAHRALRGFWLEDFGSLRGSMKRPAGSPHWCAFLNWKWISKVRVTSQFCFFFCGPGDGYIPHRRALDTEHCKYHESSYGARLNGMYQSQGFMQCFFSFFFKRKMGWASWKSVELS